MGSPLISPLTNLVVRVFTIILLVASLIVIATDNITYELDDDGDYYQTKSTDIYAYRYMLSAIVIGLVWILLQSAFTIFHFSSGNPLGGDIFAHIEFYGDKVISYLLGTGVGAGFGLTVDANRDPRLDLIRGVGAGFGLTVDANRDPRLDLIRKDFYNKANAAASLLLFSFLLSAISSVFSSYNLPKSAKAKAVAAAAATA